MNSNQQDKNLRPETYTPRAWAARNRIFGVLAAKRPALRPLSPAEENPYLQAHLLPLETLGELLLTPKQVEGVEIVQRLCRHIGRAVQQINTTAVAYELPLPVLTLPELAALLMRIDEHLIGSRCAARRLGVRAVQPKAKLAPPPAPAVQNKRRAAA